MGASNADTMSEPYFGVENGAFERTGLHVEVTALQSGGTMVQACAGDIIDVGVADVIQITNAINAGIPLAIFAAACLGNSFFHFTRELLFIHDAGIWTALRSFQAFFFYTIVLSIALIVSRLRKRTPPQAGFFRGTLCPAVSVCFFYCLLSIFAVTDYRFPLIEDLRFLGHLFFIG